MPVKFNPAKQVCGWIDQLIRTVSGTLANSYLANIPRVGVAAIMGGVVSIRMDAISPTWNRTRVVYFTLRVQLRLRI